MQHLPSIGSRVIVKTKHKSHYYFRKSEYDEYTYTGEVINGPKWITHNSFAIVTNDDPEVDFRIISAANVVDIQYLSGKPGKELDNSTQIFKVKNYTVFKSSLGYKCTCVGFQYHRKCKHINEVKENQK